MVFLARFLLGIGQSSMQEPSMGLIFQSLNPRERNQIKSGIDGILSQIGVFVIGLMLAGFMSLPLVDLRMINFVLITLVMLWFFVGLSLHRSYRKILRVTLESDRIRDPQDLGLWELAKTDLHKTAFPVEAMEFNPYLFHYRSRKQLLELLDHAHPGVRIRIWDHLMETSPGLPQLTLSQMLSSEHEPAIRERIRNMARRKLRSKMGIQEAFIRERLDRFSDKPFQVDPAIDQAFQSGEKDEVLAALYHVAQEKDTSYLPEVVSLLKNKDMHVRSVAISTAGQMDSRRVTASLIESLEHPQLYARGWSALVEQGEGILEELESTFHKPSSDSTMQRRLVSVMAAIGGVKAMDLLVEKLNYYQRGVFSDSVHGLYENYFQANELQVAKVESAIMKMVQTGAWNLAAKVSLRTSDPGGYVELAMDQEIWDVNEHILSLLALIYDRRSVHRIKVNMLDKQAEDRGMALELLDMLLKEPLKSVILSYFNDVFIREKIDQLQSIEHIELIPVDLLLRKILNRDGMQMGDFTRICVLERMGNEPRFFDEQQIIAQGFHPNPKIRETAAQILRKNDPGRYDMVTDRLDFADNSFPDHDDAASWYVHTTIKIASWKLFKDVGISSLFKLVSILQPYSEELLAEGDQVLLARSDAAQGFSPLASGIAIIVEDHPEILEQIRYLGADSGEEVYLAGREVFVELLFDDRSLLHVIGNFLNQSATGRPV
jgi:molybdopterin-biosynthesis enzyme MoeA-like protein